MAEVGIRNQVHAGIAVGLRDQTRAELPPACHDTSQHALGSAGRRVSSTNRSSGEEDDRAQLIGLQWLHRLKHMTCAAWFKNDPPKVSCVNTVASGIDHARRILTNHGVGDVRAGELTYRLAHRVGRGRQDNIAGLDEVGDEYPGPQFRFTHFTTPIDHRFGADTERWDLRYSCLSPSSQVQTITSPPAVARQCCLHQRWPQPRMHSFLLD